MKDLFPPAAVRSVADLRVLAQEFRHRQGRINLNDVANLQEINQQGLLLIRMQESGQVPEGTWTEWIETNLQVKKRQAQRYMAFARNTEGDIRDRWERAQRPKKARVLKTPAPSQSSQDGPGSTPGEEDQKDDEQPVSVPDDTPEHVRQRMGDRQLFTSALYLVRKARKAVEKVEACPTYQLVKGDLKGPLSDRLGPVDRLLNARVPQEVCEDCKGKLASCPACGGKGILTRDEVEK